MENPNKENIDLLINQLDSYHEIIKESIAENNVPKNILNMYVKTFVKIGHLMNDENIDFSKIEEIQL
jgi:uncharacterized coiled-coil DUF342 family protein